MVEYARCNRAGNRPSEADESVPQYMRLCEPDNFKPEGPGQFRHKGHSSLTFAEDGSWTYFKTKATGRTALNYLIAVEGVSFVEAVRKSIDTGRCPSFFPTCKSTPTPCREETGKGNSGPPKPDKNNYAATAYSQALIHPNVLTVCKQKRILYQTSFKDHPNCVFVGRDGNGEAKGGTLRGCSQSSFAAIFPAVKRYIRFTSKPPCHCRRGGSVRSAHRCHVGCSSLKIMQDTGNWRCSLSGAGRYGLRRTGCVSYILPEHNPHCPVP